MNDAILLKTCENRENYYLIIKYINKEIVGIETFNLLEALGEFYNKHPDIDNINFNDFALWFTTVYTIDIKSKELELYKLLFSKVGEASSAIVRDLAEAYIQKDTRSKLQDALLRNKPLEELQTILNNNIKIEKDNAEVSMDILEDTEITDRSKGLKWRNNGINLGAGGIIPGDFIVFAGRPDAGKSACVVSEGTYLAEQLPEEKDLLFFTNEGLSVHYKERIYQATFDITNEELKNNRLKYKHLYQQKMGRIDKIKLFNISRYNFSQVETIIKKHNPGLIIIDMLDHILGFKSNGNEPNDQKMRVLYRWIGDMALKHAPIIGTTQISYNPQDDPRWPPGERMTGSTTAKQEAPNLIVFIGQEQDKNSTIRYMSATKNKFKEQDNYFKFTCQFDKHKVRFI